MAFQQSNFAKLWIVIPNVQSFSLTLFIQLTSKALMEPIRLYTVHSHSLTIGIPSETLVLVMVMSYMIVGLQDICDMY